MNRFSKAVLLFCALIAGGCAGGSPDGSPGDPPGDSPGISRGDSPVDSRGDSPVAPEEHMDRTVALQFSLVGNEQNIKEMDELDASTIVTEQPVSGGTVLVYAKRDDLENVYGAFKTADAYYDLGIVGGLHAHFDDELSSIVEMDIFNKTIVRIKGVFGANAPVQNYFVLEDGSILPFLNVSTGHAVEIDLDADGSVEIVSTHGAHIQTYIYKREGDRFAYASVNEALNATTVYLDEESRIVAWFEEGNRTERYAYHAGELKSLE